MADIKYDSKNRKGRSKKITPHQILKKLKSLHYRIRLAKQIPGLEQEIIALCDKFNTEVLCGYRVYIEDGHVSLEKLPERFKQLEMTFKYSKSGKLEDVVKGFKVEKIRSYFDGDYHGFAVRLRLERNHYFSYLPYYLNSPHDVYNFMKSLGKEDRERFISIFLNVKNAVTGLDEVSVGSICSSIVHPREVFKAAILANSVGIIFVHNHPSGDPEPSKEDISLTKRLKHVSEILDIQVLDHVIIGNESYMSFKQKGLI